MASIQNMTPRDVEKLIGSPTLISLSLTNVPADEALEQFAKAAQVELKILNRETLKPHLVSIDVRDQPFWTVLDELLKQGHTTVMFDGRNTYYIQGGTFKNTGIGIFPTVDSGLFRVRAKSASRLRSVSFDGAKPVEDLQVTLELLMDPKIKQSSQMRSNTNVDITEARDDAGQPLKQQRTSRYGGGTLMMTGGGNVVLQSESEYPQRLALLRGTVSIPYTLSQETWEIPFPFKGPVSRPIGRFVYGVQSVTPTQNGYAVKFWREYAPGVMQDERPLPGNLDWMNIRVEDKAGIAYALAENSSSGFGWKPGHRIDMSLEFKREALQRIYGRGDRTFTEDEARKLGMTVADPMPPPGEAVRLVWTLPAETATVQIPFEFRDLPLP